VRSERVEFYSEGFRLVGQLKLPDDLSSSPYPTAITGPGWLGLAQSHETGPYHDGFVEHGYAILTFDYRGFGESEGERGWVRWRDQVDDLLNAVTFVETRSDLDRHRIAVYGSGGTGGGNAVYAGGLDPRVKCVIAVTAVADGPDWFRRQRREYEWVEFKRRVEANRRRRVLSNADELVDPREELMVASPERRAARRGDSTDSKVGAQFHLGSAESLLHYRPLDVVHRISPRALLLTSIEDDVVTPEDHATALYEAAGPPKKLIRQTEVKHYEAYGKNYPLLFPQFLEWLNQHLRYAPVSSRERGLDEQVVWL
jgi:dipeptidyl aminopeptidase/acylaminoacyl peptidase